MIIVVGLRYGEVVSPAMVEFVVVTDDVTYGVVRDWRDLCFGWTGGTEVRKEIVCDVVMLKSDWVVRPERNVHERDMDEMIRRDLEGMLLLLLLNLLVRLLLQKPLGVGGDLMVTVCECVDLMDVIVLLRWA